jgi:hypothetical protein
VPGRSPILKKAGLLQRKRSATGWRAIDRSNIDDPDHRQSGADGEVRPRPLSETDPAARAAARGPGRRCAGAGAARAAHPTLSRWPRGIVNWLARRLWSRNWYRRGRFLNRRWPSRVWGRNPRCSRRRVRSWTLSMHSVETPACAGLIRLPSTGGNRLYDWAASCSTRSGSSASCAIRSCCSASSNSRVLIASVVAVAAKGSESSGLAPGVVQKVGYHVR